MSMVRQAHMPGNYELYDPAVNKVGPVVCKLCWENLGKRNAVSLDTVWVSLKERRMVWWLCGSCAERVRKGGYQSTVFLKQVGGVVRSPGLRA